MTGKMQEQRLRFAGNKHLASGIPPRAGIILEG